MDLHDVGQVPEGCTLPTAERPLRVRELDRLLAAAATDVVRVAPDQLSITLRPEPQVAADVAALLVRETQCCSFFTFALTASADRLRLDVTVPPTRAAVLDGIARLASA